MRVSLLRWSKYSITTIRLLQLPLVTGADGGLQLPFLWPAGLPSGTEIYMHLAVADAQAVQGVALSSALRCVTP